MVFEIISREEGIRTLDKLPYTRFPSVRLQPLGHLSIYLKLQITLKNLTKGNYNSIFMKFLLVMKFRKVF